MLPEWAFLPAMGLRIPIWTLREMIQAAVSMERDFYTTLEGHYSFRPRQHMTPPDHCKVLPAGGKGELHPRRMTNILYVTYRDIQRKTPNVTRGPPA